MNSLLRNKLKHYLIFSIAILLSGIVGYYVEYYFSNTILTILVSGLSALLFAQLLELSFAQLKHKYYSAEDSAFNPSTRQAVEQLFSKIAARLSELFGRIDIQFYVLNWSTKQYVSFSDIETFPLQHALAYAAQNFQQVIRINDEKLFSKLPEVIALDIKQLLKQYQAVAAIPFFTNNTVYGFAFIQGSEVEVTKSLQSANGGMSEIIKYNGLSLQQILQHDAIVMQSRTAATQLKDQKRELVSWQSMVVLGLFIVMTVWWFVSPFVIVHFENNFIFDFGNVYGIVAAWGGVCAMMVARNFQAQRNMSHAFYAFGLGLLLQEFGQFSYAVYYFLWNIETPYPSIGDVGFFGSVLAYIVGVIFLIKATGITFRIKTFTNQLITLIVPLAMLLFGYLLFLQNYQFNWSEPIRIILDFGYPLFGAIYVSIAILIYLLTRDTKGATKNRILLIVVALIWQFLCDYTFLYQASRGTWEVNGLNDYMYLISYVLMSLAILQFHNRIADTLRSKL